MLLRITANKENIKQNKEKLILISNSVIMLKNVYEGLNLHKAFENNLAMCVKSTK